METIVSSHGQISLPASLRKRDQIRAGQRFAIERLQAGQYLLKKESQEEGLGLVDWLLSCPEKDWFEPISSESTSEL